MKYFEYFDLGYELMASVTNIDDAIETAEYYMQSSNCLNCFVGKYKNEPGQEDAYCILLLSQPA